jgi:two-component system LytT family response regulator
MLTCLIVDDDPHCRSILKAMLESEFPKLEAKHVARNLAEALQLNESIKPDIVFLDVELGDGSGFDFLEKAVHTNFKIIFTTAFDSYAIKAFKVNATDYLLKPFSSGELKTAVEKAISQQTTTGISPEMRLLMDYMNGNKSRIALPVQSGFEFINVTEILRCEAEGNYTKFYMKGGKTHLVSKTLKTYENLLETEGFCRIHAAHLINLKEIKTYHKGEGGYVVMNDGTSVEVSRSRKDDFLAKLKI